MIEQSSSLGLSRNELAKLSLIYGVLLIVTLLGFSVSFAIGRTAFALAGLGVISYVFGLRHGVDADHIAAIDNTTRKLMQEGRRPLTVGMWFSLGHSTVVVVLIVALVLATRAVTSVVPALASAGSIIGTLVSGGFLWIIGLINVVIVLGIYKIFQTLKQGKLDQAQLDQMLENRGFMNRFFRRFFSVVKKPWQIYPIGVLFGLGFDTASEIALIAISVGVGVSTNIPVYYILILPMMFTCGMVTIDTTDGVAMMMAYGWAFLNPFRKLYYNLTITMISILVAWAVGTVELLQVLSIQLNLTGGFWAWLNALDFETMGFGIVGIFVISWLVAMAYWKYQQYDRRFTLSQPSQRSPGMRAS